MRMYESIQDDGVSKVVDGCNKIVDHDSATRESSWISWKSARGIVSKSLLLKSKLLEQKSGKKVGWEGESEKLQQMSNS